MDGEPSGPEALVPFFRRNLITEVVQQVKSGKEGSVFCCRAHPATGETLLAAKIFRSYEQRTFRNDAVYREGRALRQRGRVVRGRSLQRALEAKTRLGWLVQVSSWAEYEYETLTLLHAAGGDVPRPVAKAENAMLMQYIGAEEAPAPPLIAVRLGREEAETLFARVVANVELFLRHNRVHADLSAFNILYWEGEITVIDFPQAVDPRFNGSALDFLRRDLKNVCRYFGRWGVQADAEEIAASLWQRFLYARL